MAGEDDNNWHLDKRVPISLILAIVAQTAGFAWWGATQSEKLASLERRMDVASPLTDRMVRVETKLEAVQDTLTEMKTIMIRGGRGVP